MDKNIVTDEGIVEITGKKYELITDKWGNTRIKALRDIIDSRGGLIAREGEIGGIVSGEDNLSHEGGCWISYEAKVLDYCIVEDDSQIKEKATLNNSIIVRGRSVIRGEAKIEGSYLIEDSYISGRSYIYNCYYMQKSKPASTITLCDLSGGVVVEGEVILNSCVIADTVSIDGYNIKLYNCAIRDNVSIRKDTTLIGDKNRRLVIRENASIVYSCINVSDYSGLACLGDSIVINSNFEDIKYFSFPLGGRPLTALKTKWGWRYNIGCQYLITASEFVDRIFNYNGGLALNPHRQNYLDVISMIEKKSIEELKEK